MVEIINSWAQKIIIVVIICTVIEMILPEGKNKKYIKTVIGIYVVFTIISPIISNLNTGKSLDLEQYLDLNNNNEAIEVSSNIDTNKYIEEVYKEKLKTDIETKLNSINYEVRNINIEIETEDEETYGTILKVELNVSKQEEVIENNNIKVEKIVIGENNDTYLNSNISDEEREKLKIFIYENYGVDKEKIIIK
ncbi:MAG: stage III sporulation protein AF [Clostridia bacterium]